METQRRHGRFPSVIQRILAVALVPVLVWTSWPRECWASYPTRHSSGANVPAPSLKVNVAASTRLPTGGGSPALRPRFSFLPTDAEISRARVFEEPLIPIGGHSSLVENRALAQALLAYVKQGGQADTQLLTRFLAKYPRSAWRASLLINLGILYQLKGATSQALSAWEEAWSIARGETDLKARALADRAIGELVDLTARLGQDERLESLLEEVQGRDLVGSAGQKVANARDTLWSIRHSPETTLRCGFFALARVRSARQPGQVWDDRLVKARATPQGTSLAHLNRLADDVEMKYQMARRPSGARVVLPAVVHFSQGHYAALVKERNGRYLIHDPTLPSAMSGELWLDREVLDSEGSGYYLVPDGPLPDGWTSVSESEGGAIWGRGPTTRNVNNTTGDGETTAGPCSTSAQNNGMAQHALLAMLVGLIIADTPVSYKPPRGPPINFRVTYSQREAYQPAVFNYSTLGPKWTFNWLSYITDDPNNPSANISLYLRGGGTEFYRDFNSTTQSYARHVESEAVIVRTSASPIRYERRLPDGSTEVFAVPSGTTAPRKVFMTQIIDPSGNTVSLTYDANLRLMGIADALSQVTTLTYDDGSGSPLLIRRVTDPFGRFASFEYDVTGRLVRITDPIGITSEFAYDGGGSFINALTTPYGTTRFAFADLPGNQHWLTATDPLGATERIEFRHAAPGIPTDESAIPSGMRISTPQYLQYRNTFYWDKKAWAEYGGDRPDYTKARIYHWLHQDDAETTSNVLESEKKPFESRVWYNYPGSQPFVIWFSGSTHGQPSKIGRVLDDGETQLTQFEYNNAGKITRLTDPAGRVFSFTYAANDIDLLETRQTRGTNNELLARLTYNNPDVPEQRCAPATQRSTHLVCSRTDAAGQTTRFTYNQFGQPLTATNPRNETTTFTYDAEGRGYLMLITGALPGSTTRLAYDTLGRLQSVTNPDDYTVTFAYDAADRLTRVTYPDSTFEEISYGRLDPQQFTDRLGRVTTASYNALRQLVAWQDASTPPNVTRFEWCGCSALEKVTDPSGHETRWTYDVQGRVIRKTFADGSQTRYAYEQSTSRLSEIIDAKGQRTEFSYDIADNRRQIARIDTSLVATPPVVYSYDPNYNRIVTKQDGTGLTRYSYHPIASTPTLGAGQLASVIGPLPNSAITYQYDQLGRVVQRAVNGVTVTWTYDELGRVARESNPLGDVDYRYAGATERLDSIAYPNGQTTTFNYYTTKGDLRLQEITNLSPAGSLLSRFNYEYTPIGQISLWGRQRDKEAPTAYTYEYDAVDQIRTATSSSPGTTQYSYDYDPAGNRTVEQVDDAVMPADYNSLNQVTNRQVATLPDPDPVLHRSEIAYDGLGRRVRLIERENGIVTNETRFLWCGSQLCEERDASGATVTKRFFAQGMQSGGNNYYYTRDHLGNVREMTDQSGAVRARYEYDPYGRRTKVSGDLDADLGFTGHYFHTPSGLHLALFRAYDANLGRWISRDPIAEVGSLNLYGYVANNPGNYVDPDGRWFWGVVVGLLKTVVAVVTIPTIGLPLLALAIVAGLVVWRYGASVFNEESQAHLARKRELDDLFGKLCLGCEASTYPETCAKILCEIQWRKLAAINGAHKTQLSSSFTTGGSGEKSDCQ